MGKWLDQSAKATLTPLGEVEREKFQFGTQEGDGEPHPGGVRKKNAK